MDGLVISTNLKLNNFTHFNGPLQSTEQKHRPSASERLHGRRSRQVPAVILLLLRTSASHRTDTWGIVDQTYNANCPEILQLKLHKNTCAIISLAGQPIFPADRASNYPDRSTDICAIHGFLRRVWIRRLRKQIHGYRRSTDCAQQHNWQYPSSMLLCESLSCCWSISDQRDTLEILLVYCDTIQ